jgi:hypothetical protein
VVDVCATNAVDSAAVVDDANVFRLYSVSSKTVRRSLVVIDFQTLFNYWYSVPLCQDLPTQGFNRYAVRPSSTQLCM